MSYYIQESEPSRTGTYPEITDLFPDGVQTKDELVSWLDDGFKTCQEEGIEVKWVSYFTGYNAGAGTVYALSTDYANQIGYNGPVSARTSNFILVMGNHLNQDLRELTVKGMKKMKKSKKFIDDIRHIFEPLGKKILSPHSQFSDNNFIFEWDDRYYQTTWAPSSEYVSSVTVRMKEREVEYLKNNADDIEVRMLDKDVQRMFDEAISDIQQLGYNVSYCDYDRYIVCIQDLSEDNLMKSTKKSISNIHDMIAQCRQNNNSLVKSRVDLKKFGPENPEDDFQREMASLGKILDASGVQFNLDVRDFPSGGYGYEIKFPTKEIGEQVFNEVADWGDEHGFYTWLQDDGTMSLTPN